MSRESIIFFIGILLIIVQYLGVPEDWKTVFYIAAGVIAMVLGYSLRRDAYLRSIEHQTGERRAESYVEQTPNVS